ncbi:MAG: hypothetical protein HZA81_02900 [Candidatus Taylorbacteria bacterium]|nr:hypothetical protein [Candidatus Taylorbacteria bacterium]
MTKRISIIVAVVVALLMVPLVAMQFTEEVQWTGSDFAAMGALLFITGLILDFAVRKAGTTPRKIGFAAAILLGFVYIWAELAVGIFTNIGS